MPRSTSADIIIRLLSDASGFKKGMKEAQWAAASTAQKLQAVGGIMSGIGRKMTIGVTLPIVAGFALATKAAMDEEKQIALLSKAMQTNVKATQAQVDAAEKWITAMQNATGVADTELRPALATLVTATRDTGKAQDLLQVAMDLSAAKGKPLASVVNAIAKAYLGNVGALGRLGVVTKSYGADAVKVQEAQAKLAKAEEDYNKVLKDSTKTAADRAVAAAKVAKAHDDLKTALTGATGKALTFEQVMRRIQKSYGGAGETAAKTSAGQMAILKARFVDLEQEVGRKVLPVLEDLIPVVSKLLSVFEKMPVPLKNTFLGLTVLAAATGPILELTGGVLKLVGALMKLRKVKPVGDVLGGLTGGAGGGLGGVGAGAAGSGATTALGMGIGTAVAGAVGLGVAAGLVAVLPTIIIDKLGKGSKAHQQFIAAGEEAGKAFATTGFAKGTQAALILGGTPKYQAKGAAKLAAEEARKAFADYKPLVLYLEAKWRTLPRNLALQMEEEIQHLREMAAAGIDFKLTLTMGPAKLTAWRDSLMAEFHLTKNQATKIMADMGVDITKLLSTDIPAKIKQNKHKIADAVKNSIETPVHHIVTATQKSAKEATDALATGLAAGHGPIRNAATKLANPVVSTGASIVSKLTSAGKLGPAALASGLGKTGPTKTAADKLGAAAKDGIPGLPGVYARAAKLAVSNLVSNLRAGIGPALGAALALANASKPPTGGGGGGGGGGGSNPHDTPPGKGIIPLNARPDWAASLTNIPDAFADRSAAAMQNLRDLMARGGVLIDALAAIKNQIVDLTKSIMATVDLWPQYVETVDELGNKVRTLNLPTVEAVSAADMGATMDANVANMKAWVANMDKLRAAGLPKELLDELTAMGLGGAGQVAGLASMTAEQLAKWTKGWLDLQALAGEQAKATFKDAADAAVAAIEAFTRALLNALSKFGGGTLTGVTSTIAGTSGVKQLAAGGIVTRPTLALVGEGGPEAVVPLSGRSGGGGGGGNRIIVNQHNSFAIYALEPDDRLVAKFAQKLQTVSRRAAIEMSRKVPR